MKLLIVGYSNTKVRFQSKVCFKSIEVYELFALNNNILGIHDADGNPVNILNIEEFFNPSPILLIAAR
jgi:hypothetical protein